MAAKQQGAAAGGAPAEAAAGGGEAQQEQLEVGDVMEAFGNLSEEEARAAALKIQAIQRGRQARKQVAQKRASMKMQAAEEPAAPMEPPEPLPEEPPAE